MNNVVNNDKRIQLQDSFYNSKKNIGVIYAIDSITFYKNGKQSFIADLLTDTNKFEKPFKTVSNKILLDPLIKELYRNLFTEKDHNLVEIDLKLSELKKNKRFKEPENIKTKYFKYDVRSLKKYSINTLLLVSANYNMNIEYDGIIRENEEISCTIKSTLIDLNTNSILHDDCSVEIREIYNLYYGEDPDYINLTKTIKETIQATIEKEKSKLSL